jgi:superfamily II DNA/RNA helicase
MSNEGTTETIVTADGTVETNFHEVIDSFDDMQLKDDLLRGIYSYGFEKPSAIQQRAIKPLLMMKDTIAQAQSGTGKTATFTIGLLQNIDLANKDCQALILAPTRELASQIVKVVMAIGDYLQVSTMVRGARLGPTRARAREGTLVPLAYNCPRAGRRPASEAPTSARTWTSSAAACSSSSGRRAASST